MPLDDTESDAFFDALGGRRPAEGERPASGAQAMRAALLAQANTVREAQAAQASDLSAEEAAQMAELKLRLVQQGVLKKSGPQAHKTGSLRMAQWWQGLVDALLGGGWQRPMAVAASLMLVSAVVLKLALPPSTDPDIERGSSDIPELISPAPAQAAEKLAAKLKAAGGDVLLVQTDEQAWILRVTVPPHVNSASIARVLNEAGVKVSGAGPYRVLIHSGRQEP